MLAGFACSWVAAPMEFTRDARFKGTAEQAAHAVEHLAPPGTPVRVAESRMESLAFNCARHEPKDPPSAGRLSDRFEERRTAGDAYGESATHMAAGLGCYREDEPDFWGIRQWMIHLAVEDGLVVGVTVYVQRPSL